MEKVGKAAHMPAYWSWHAPFKLQFQLPWQISIALQLLFLQYLVPSFISRNYLHLFLYTWSFSHVYTWSLHQFQTQPFAVF